MKSERSIDYRQDENVLEYDVAVGGIDAARELLDRFGVAGRLRHLGQYVWRGGALHFRLDDDDERPPSLWYELEAHWPAAVFEPLPNAQPGLASAANPVLDGRWVSGTAGYVLKIGLDFAAPSSIFIRTDRPFSNVPFLHRAAAQVEHALSADLAAYAEWFLDTCPAVPQAARLAARRLYSQAVTSSHARPSR